MSSGNFIKNITSKDISLSKNTINKMINSPDSSLFEQLCQNCDFIFPFLKERITLDFVKLIKEDNLKTIFEFSKIYCADFEEMIVKSWVKFADENLTDEILDLLQNGSDEQKAYAVLYFKYIKDNLCIEYLNKLAKSDFQPLKINCAKVLSEFQEKEVLYEMMDVAKNTNDDFEALSAFEFISAYGGVEAIEFILKNAFKNSFSSNIISNLLDFNDFETIKNNSSNENVIRIFNSIIEAYPEDIGLDTILYYQIFDFIEYIKNINSQYAKNSLIIAKEKFFEFVNNDIYSFDLDKNSKDELKEISKLLESLDLSLENLDKELDEYKDERRFCCALEVIRIKKAKEYAKKISNLINENKLSYQLMAQASMILKEISSTSLINREVINNIENENIKALIESCLI